MNLYEILDFKRCDSKSDTLLVSVNFEIATTKSKKACGAGIESG